MHATVQTLNKSEGNTALAATVDTIIMRTIFGYHCMGSKYLEPTSWRPEERAHTSFNSSYQQRFIHPSKRHNYDIDTFRAALVTHANDDRAIGRA